VNHGCRNLKGFKQQKPNGARKAAPARLLNLGFFEFDMFPHDGVVFAKAHLFRGVARVFLRYVEKAGVCGADKTDFDRGWLRHGPFLKYASAIKQKSGAKIAAIALPLCQGAANVKGFVPI
jgi:hypothetical protein